jgi:hypothetical protein
MPPLHELTNERAAQQREAAIVPNVPGTTRNILEISLDIGGLPVVVVDTAGLRETTDEVEQIGVERVRKACVSSASSSSSSSKNNATSCVLICLCACFPQSSSCRRLASRTRVPRRRLLRDALLSTAQHSTGARSARDPKHVHPAQQNRSTPHIRASADGAYKHASAARLGRQPYLATRHQ